MTENLLGPDPVHLPDDAEIRDALEAGTDVYEVVKRHPESPLAWASVSDIAWADGRMVETYAFARVGYHRGLDLLRRNGWKGHGPIPVDHLPNQGFLRCLSRLGEVADEIGEVEEAQRIGDFLEDATGSRTLVLDLS